MMVSTTPNLVQFGEVPNELTLELAIGSQESSMQTAQVIAQFGGGVLASVLPPAEDVPATVQGKMGKCSTIPFQPFLIILAASV